MSLSNLIGSFLGTVTFKFGYEFMFFLAFILAFLAFCFYIVSNYKILLDFLKYRDEKS